VTRTTVAVGNDAERRAEQWMRASGLVTEQRNYRCRGGELDLVMRDGDTLVFVEVRFRRSDRFGGPLASVDRRKQHRVATAAAHYLQRHAWRGPCRFDVIGIGPDNEPPDWVRDAFRL
jgi:putative endonuclease